MDKLRAELLLSNKAIEDELTLLKQEELDILASLKGVEAS
jgi:hypothetical protein